MLRAAYVCLFGVVGVLSRYFGGLAMHRMLPQGVRGFPVWTFAINILGGFLIGSIYMWGELRPSLSPDLRAGLIIGLLGGFTTFSAYSLETLLLFDEARYLTATLYFVLSPVLALMAAWAGHSLARQILA